jgi:energy-converting hydrogenase Eha subunit B
MDSRLTIDRMRLSLPPGYAGRAGAIARQVAAQLSRMPLASAGRIAGIALPALTAQPGESDAALAGRIARAIHTEIGRTLARQTTIAEPRLR